MTPLTNVQPVERPDYKEDGTLDVHSVFLTIQGEGPLAGTPAVFVRLAGCDLACPRCFYGSTKIRMADFSTKLISEVRIGDSVLSYDEESGQFVPRKVTAVMSSQTRSVYKIDNGANGKTYVTGEHPFLVRDRGWVRAKDLNLGDRVLHLSLSELRRLHNPMKNQEVVDRMVATARSRGHLRSPMEYMSEAEKAAVRENNRQRMLSNNPMKNPEVALKGYLARKDRGKMSGPEKFVIGIAKDLGLRFVGGGDVVVGFKIPDFIIEGTNKLVEIWDQEQTEYLGRNGRWMQERRELFEKEGYEVLFLPVCPYPLHNRVGTRKNIRKHKRTLEIKRIRSLIAEYARNGAIIKGLQKITARSNPKAWVRLAGSLKADLTVYNLEVEGTHTYIANTMVAHNCDTDYTSRRASYSPQGLMAEVARVQGDAKARLVVLTGGEPFRQNVSPFCSLIYGRGYDLQVETNGTLYPPVPVFPGRSVSIVCSPKTPLVHEQVQRLATAFKYVLDADHVSEGDGLPTAVLGMSQAPARPAFKDTPVYLQPADDKDPDRNRRNMEAAVKSCLRFGYRLSLQQHKVLGLE